MRGGMRRERICKRKKERERFTAYKALWVSKFLFLNLCFSRNGYHHIGLSSFLLLIYRVFISNFLSKLAQNFFELFFFSCFFFDFLFRSNVR